MERQKCSWENKDFMSSCTKSLHVAVYGKAIKTHLFQRFAPAKGRASKTVGKKKYTTADSSGSSGPRSPRSSIPGILSGLWQAQSDFSAVK